MIKPSTKFRPEIEIALLVAIIIALIMSGYVAYQYRLLDTEFKALEEQNQKLTAELGASENQNTYLLGEVRVRQEIIDSFGGQIQNIGQTVSDLDKLAKTDPELLNKYSKVYFLNENYVPAALESIPANYTYTDNSNGNYLIHAQVWSYLKKLLDAARSDGIELLIASAFRSFDTQASLKAGYTVTYGSGANQFSADQGYSEHQLGSSVDFTTPLIAGAFSKFETDPAYQWLLDNAHNYGFVLSYPKGNAYYKFEPWHWRFVGVELARDLDRQGKHFYDLSQREIDAYLIKLFD